ncbi:MAG: CheY-like superfamily [Olpidium bornovanus]|uniref:CheY-like superfamily n=1 Tax=Olpidium bornovanus TaxID=278681 RepID=A0A8H7ZSP1_9FUNG|nr:MAG: CheY-like superfamily [Olpidium bornovanus]
MGGSLRVSSAVGAGSTFSFTIPLEEPSPHDLERDRPRNPSARATPVSDGEQHDRRAPGEKFPIRILLAEDNATNVKVATAMLAKLRFTDVSVVGNGEEAVRAVRERNSTAGYGGGLAADAATQPPPSPKSGGRVDVVLMDMQMPIMSGITATTIIRADASIHQPIVVALTANAMETDKQKCLDAGMDDFLTKPIKLGALEAIMEMCATKVQEREKET